MSRLRYLRFPVRLASMALLVALFGIPHERRALAGEADYEVASLAVGRAGAGPDPTATIPRAIALRPPASLGEAIRTLRRAAGQMGGAEKLGLRVRLAADLVATQDYLLKLGGSEQRLATIQWHRIGDEAATPGLNRAVFRPLRPMRPVSSVALDVRDGTVVVERVRVHASKRGVYEFNPRVSLDATRRHGEALLLDREIELTAVEVWYRFSGNASRPPMIGVHGGISTQPPYERASATKLGIVRRELELGRYREAERHLQTAILLLETHRRTSSP
jgi:hypothetical protein